MVSRLGTMLGIVQRGDLWVPRIYRYILTHDYVWHQRERRGAVSGLAFDAHVLVAGAVQAG
jgi:hypothetical protein